MEAIDATTADNLSRYFQWPDYLVLGTMMMVSALIGIYYACSGTKQNSTSEFLMAGRNMGTFPVAMSLLASFLSAIALLGLPAEVYFYGTQVSFVSFSFLLVMPMTSYIYMPVFYELQLTSAYEYLELRFNKLVRCICSAIFTVQTLMYMAVVVYAPALALSQVAGIDVMVSVSSTILVCIFYTALGGMKAVVWTDTLQVIIMYGSILGVVIKGCYDVGGPAAIWTANDRSGRIELFNMDLDPSTRHTVWNLLISQGISWLAAYGVSQTQVQRYLTIPTISQVRSAIWINLVGIITLFLVCYCAGMILYAKYEHCDPFTAKLVTKPDQMFPFFVMETLGRFPGIPGLFVAGVFSGSLSTVSSGLNSLSAITLEDFVRPYCMPKMTDQTATKLSKALAVFYGLVCFGFVLLASSVQSIIEATGTFTGINAGPLLAVFTLGMLVPWANAQGTAAGLILGSAFMCWIGFGTLAAKSAGLITAVRKPLSIDGCLFNSTTVLSNSTKPFSLAAEPNEVLSIYKLSYAWYPAFGFSIVLVLGLTFSLLYKRQDPKKLDPRLVCNLGDAVFWFLPERAREFLRFNVGDDYIPKKTESHRGEVNASFVPDVSTLPNIRDGKSGYASSKV